MFKEFGSLRVITHVKPHQTLEGKLNSYNDVYVWKVDKDTNSLVDPKVRTLVVSRAFYTKHFREHQLPRAEQTINELTSLLRSTVYEDYNTKLNQKKNQLSKYKTNKSKGAQKLISEISIIETAIDDLKHSIRVKGPFKKQGRFTYVIETPHLEDSQLLLLNNLYEHNSRFTKTSDLITRNLGGVFNELFFLNKPDADLEIASDGLDQHYFFQAKDFPNTIRNQFSKTNPKTLLNSKALSIDFETTEWKQESISEADKELTKKELIKKYDLDESLESLTKQALLDLAEKRKDEPRNERIVTATLCNAKDDKHYLVSTLPLRQELRVRIPGSQELVEVEQRQANNQEELMSIVNEIIKAEQPLHMFGHKHTDFDYRIAKQLTDNFKPGICSEEPQYMWGLPNKFMQVRIAPGRLDLEPSSYYQHNSWIRNNKLDTVFEDLTETLDKKSMNHQELEQTIRFVEDENNALEERLELAERINSYAVKDSIKSFIICSKLLPEVLQKAYLFNTTPLRVCTTSKKTLVEEYWTDKSVDETNSFLYKDPRREFIAATPELRKIRRGKTDINWQDFDLEDFQERIINYHLGSPKAERGFGKARLVYFHPHVKALKEFFSHDEVAKQIYDEGFADKNKRIRQYKALEAIISYPFFKILQYSNQKLSSYSKGEKDSLEKRFSAEFRLGFKADNLKRCHDTLVKYYQSLAKGLQTEELINHRGSFYLIKEPDTLSEFCEKIEHYNFGTELGIVDSLSIKKGIFAASLDGQLLVFGLADPKSNKGEKNLLTKELLERSLYKSLVERDVAGMLKFVRDSSSDLQNGLVSPDKLVFEREVKRHFTDYSDKARQSYIQMIAEQQLRQGETLSYSKSNEELLEQILGVKMLGGGGYGFDRRNLMRGLVLATKPLSLSSNGVGNTLNSVLTGRATDEEITCLVDQVYNSKE